MSIETHSNSTAVQAAGFSMQWTSKAVRWTLALVLLIAAFLKAKQLASVPALDPRFIANPWTQAAIIQVELILGIWLLFNCFDPLASAISCLLFAIMAAVSFGRLLSGSQSCGCFGAVEVPPSYTLILDLGACISLWAFCFRVKSWSMPPKVVAKYANSKFSRRLVGIALLFAFASIVVPAWALREQSALDKAKTHAVDDVRVIDVKDWIGKPLPLLEDIEIDDDLADGKWVLVLYRFDCSMCEEAMPRYRELAKAFSGQPDQFRVAFIEIPTGSLAGNPETSDSYSRGNLASEFKWFGLSPAVAIVEDGVVKTAKQGEDAINIEWITESTGFKK